MGIKSKFKSLEDAVDRLRGKAFKNTKSILNQINFKRVAILFGIIVLTTLILAISFTTFSFLRHRQLCSYQPLIDSGVLVSPDKVNLCPNMLDSAEWGNIITNAFNFNITNSLSVSDQEISEQDLAECNDQLNPLCWVKGSKPTLKSAGGFTNLLIAGVDSRAVGSSSGLQNTDTLMMISLNHATGKLMFLSFPRDLYLDYYRPNGYKVKYKINAVYAIDGVEGISGVITQVTGKPIHYYAFVDIQLFKDIIDRLGGVTITLDKDFADLYPCKEVPKRTKCPQQVYSGDGWYGLFEFKRGTHKFNSFQSLVYSRSRKYSSDFDRALRQQNLLSAVLKNVLDSPKPLGEKVSLYLDLYNLFEKRVKTNIELKDIAAMFTFIDKLDSNSVKLVIDGNLGGGGIIQYVGTLPGLGWSIGFTDPTYQTFKAFLNRIWNNIAFYADRPKILVVNHSGSPLPNNSYIKNLAKRPFAKVKHSSSSELKTGTRIYDLSEGAKKGTVFELLKRIPGSLQFSSKIDSINQSEFKEDVLIIWGSN